MLSDLNDASPGDWRTNDQLYLEGNGTQNHAYSMVRSDNEASELDIFGHFWTIRKSF